MKVCFETFGCRLNKAEALQMEAEYLAKGWELTDRHSDANLFIVRGCSVTARAQAECEKLVAHLRKNYPSVPMRICGCLENKIATAGQKKRVSAVAEPFLTPSETQPLPTRTARAYLKVQDGCSGRCTFCIVPKFRGASRAEAFDGLLDKSRRLIESGYREIVVTGCNLSLYASQGKRLPDLVAALAELSPDCRIRIGSLEPGACALETVDAMAEHPDNVCRFLHLPIQSGSVFVLKAMLRPYTVKDIEAVVNRATDRMPGLGLGCDVMTGFPGETEADFFSTLNLIRKLPFTNAHVFPYSKRPGTVAAALSSHIEKSVRAERAHELGEVMKDLRRKYAKTFVGKTVEIIVEHDKRCIGWTSEYLACEAVGKAARKARVRILVTKVTDDKLSGRIA